MDTRNQIINFMVDRSGITDEKVKEELLATYLNSDIDLQLIADELEKYKKHKVSNKSKVYKLHKSNGTTQDINIQLLEKNKYGTSGVYHVLVDNKDKAYFKSSAIKYIDDVDLSISEISNIFHVKVAKIYRVSNEDGRSGILSYDIKTIEDASYRSLGDVYREYYSKYKAGKVTNLKWITELLSLPKTSKDKPLVREDYIKVVIDMGINILKDHMNLSDKQLKKIKKDYINILLFDYITNQADRSLDNINLVFDEDKVSFAPLYDNGNVYNEEIGVGNTCLLDYICSRQAVLKTLFKYYYDEISENIDRYRNKDEYMDRVEKVIKKNLNEKNSAWYLNLFYRNVEQVILLYKQQKELKSNKVVKEEVNLSLQYGYVKAFSLLLSMLLVLLFIVILATVIYS